MNLDVLYQTLVEHDSGNAQLVQAATWHAIRADSESPERSDLQLQLAGRTTDRDALTRWSHSNNLALKTEALANSHTPTSTLLEALELDLRPWQLAAIVGATTSADVVALVAGRAGDELYLTLLRSPLLHPTQAVKLLTQRESTRQPNGTNLGLVRGLSQQPRLAGLFAQAVSTTVGVRSLIGSGQLRDFSWDTLARRVEDLSRRTRDASLALAFSLHADTPLVLAQRVAHCAIAVCSPLTLSQHRRLSSIDAAVRAQVTPDTLSQLLLHAGGDDPAILAGLTALDPLPEPVRLALLDNPYTPSPSIIQLLTMTSDLALPAELLSRIVGRIFDPDTLLEVCLLTGPISLSHVTTSQRLTVFNLALSRMTEKERVNWLDLARSFTDDDLDSLDWSWVIQVAKWSNVTSWLTRRLTTTVTDTASAAMFAQLSAVYTGASGDLFTAVVNLLDR